MTECAAAAVDVGFGGVLREDTSEWRAYRALVDAIDDLMPTPVVIVGDLVGLYECYERSRIKQGQTTTQVLVTWKVPTEERERWRTAVGEVVEAYHETLRLRVRLRSGRADAMSAED